MASVTLPDSVYSIGSDAFGDSDVLSAAYSSGSKKDVELTLVVPENSYAAQYAEENGIPYTFG